MDPLILSRIQFGFTVAFHILFPAFTIGLSAWLAVVEGLWLKTGRDVYYELARFWSKIFAVSFGMGVVSGIVMSYSFGTNWAVFSNAASPVMGPLLAYEVLTAFFLEAAFLGIMLFGWNRVPRWMHFTATVLVAIGTSVSAFWILSANSWMQTPAGFELRNGVFYPEDWLAIIFNPSFPYRFVHMLFAAFLSTALVIGGVGAWYLLKRKSVQHGRIMSAMAVGLLAVMAPAQLIVGDLHGLNTQEHQPRKVAAMEGHWESKAGAPLILFAVPDQEAQTNHFEIGIPYLGSMILKHSWTGEVTGLKEWAPEDQPSVGWVFYSFRIMVAIGLVMIALGLIGAFLLWRGKLFQSRRFLRAQASAIPLGFIAVLTGWIVTEVGRQPYIVHGIMRTSEGVTQSLSGGGVLTTLILFGIVYTIIFGAGMFYMIRLAMKGPEADQRPEPGGHPKRPLSAVSDSTAPAE
ncbi:cytochrome bd-I ubiquinol oxidase subunit 1 apoprotein [Limimonas halophila]|uniref:Cytochrome bd-I ubiquinol oxidase subunit 1 apoprotein n=1 Tax=Limimonas halophila TaxID=1082479 RepID=A0A1G7UW95_9PROT|nr:cytochrome ubiquinol oxidase subunit I [Limimonas halophila]SDG51419.1 cytochrome bd-I ubiquinol oxidase subunit 1 apoprotein [Limimonas halophila]